ncbi:NAD-dependent epimerase/dehydratase family protein [Fulvivirga sp. M361]|uniref:NAD-dependent epimerase/dehydratase family protein n=1 Tax=Fulvivirga sp. M361 TaxID=2594266 RepID=UPI00117B52C8|nr:NAD-dependent epimerase/dehydratase family protein [Fulvivirga sp. M361]TRX50238.1 NAD-dependent epimerase/dehydratase family protein [Fulvivirga sp. M361]
MNILITGITGFIGSNLYHYLKTKTHDEHEINFYALTRDRDKVEGQFRDNNIHIFTKVDSALIDQYKIEVIIHLAGIAHDLSGIYKDNDYERVNYGLSKHLYDEFIASDTARKFIYLSSVKALADRAMQVLTEEQMADPKTAYGKSKLKAENYISSIKTDGKKTYVLRPSMVYGPGNKGNLNLLYNLIKKGYPYPLGAFYNKRSFLSVNNLNFVMSQIIAKEIPEGDYNCADGSDISTIELVKLIGMTINKPARILKINKKMILQISKIGTLLRLPLNENTLKKLVENYQVSTDKLLNVLGIEGMPYNTLAEFRATIKSFEDS